MSNCLFDSSSIRFPEIWFVSSKTFCWMMGFSSFFVFSFYSFSCLGSLVIVILAVECSLKFDSCWSHVAKEPYL